ncbi:hypothetical protein WR25_23453 [Diploscapter pachys]|uniref:Uncharacterized protein n=1 Tax=Diploscapter pachys TaxID=2018661 RepID=A0A2A2KIF7_9BILA|nr:hypothetical protein WR25_23453 [Diploscapter pachys]
MRVRLGQDFLGRARFHELGQHLAVEMARILDPAVKLAVRERTRPALTELDVRFGVELATPPQTPGILGALAHHLAAIDDDRAESHLGEDQAREQATRPRPDHHRPWPGVIRRRLGNEAIAGVRRRPDVAVAAAAGQHRALVLHRHVDGIDELDVHLVARVIRPPRHRIAHQIARPDPQPIPDRRRQRLLGMIEGEFQLIDAQHAARIADAMGARQSAPGSPSRCAPPAPPRRPSRSRSPAKGGTLPSGPVKTSAGSISIDKVATSPATIADRNRASQRSTSATPSMPPSRATAVASLPPSIRYAAAQQLVHPPPRRGRRRRGQRIGWEEARLGEFDAIDLWRVGGRATDEPYRIAPSLGARVPSPDDLGRIQPTPGFFQQLTQRRRDRRLTPRDATARQHPQIGPAIAMPHQQHPARCVERHHLHAARPPPDQRHRAATQAIGEIDQRTHSACSIGSRGRPKACPCPPNRQ